MLKTSQKSSDPNGGKHWLSAPALLDWVTHHLIAMASEHNPAQGFGEQICNVLSGVDVLEQDHTFFHLLSQIVKANSNVL